MKVKRRRRPGERDQNLPPAAGRLGALRYLPALLAPLVAAAGAWWGRGMRTAAQTAAPLKAPTRRRQGWSPGQRAAQRRVFQHLGRQVCGADQRLSVNHIACSTPLVAPHAGTALVGRWQYS